MVEKHGSRQWKCSFSSLLLDVSLILLKFSIELITYSCNVCSSPGAAFTDYHQDRRYFCLFGFLFLVFPYFSFLMSCAKLSCPFVMSYIVSFRCVRWLMVVKFYRDFRFKVFRSFTFSFNPNSLIIIQVTSILCCNR